MIILAHGPRLDAPIAQRPGELLGEAVEREHALRLHRLDEAQEIRVIRVVGKGKRGVALIPEDRAGIHGPARDDGGASAGNLTEKSRTAGLRWTDHDVSRDLVRVEAAVGRKRDPEFVVDARQPQRLRVQHHRQLSGGEPAQEFLTFAEAVAEEHGRLAIVEAVVAEARNVPQHVFGGRKNILRPAERRLHDQHVGPRRRAAFGGTAGPQFEVARVEQRAVLLVDHQTLGRAVNMPGGMQRHVGIGREWLGLSERQHVFGSLAGQTGPHES